MTKLKRLSVLLITLFVANACTKPEDIIKDFQIHVTPTFFDYIVEIKLSDLSDPNAEWTAPATVSLEGADASFIYNIDGTKNFSVNNGTIQLFVARGAEPLEGNPVSFKVIVESPNCETAKVPVTVDVEDYYISYEAGLLNYANLPTTVTVQEKSEDVDPVSGNLVAPVTFNTGSSDSSGQVDLTIPTDVQFLDMNGQVILARTGGAGAASGLETQVVAFSDTSSVGLQIVNPNLKSFIQRTEPPTSFHASGDFINFNLPRSTTFWVEAYLNGKLVDSIKSPDNNSGLTFKIPVSDKLINAEFNRPYQAGDSVSFLSVSNRDRQLNFNGDVWKVGDQSFVVTESSGKLFVEGKFLVTGFYKMFYRSNYWKGTPSNLNQYGFTAVGGGNKGLNFLVTTADNSYSRFRIASSWPTTNAVSWGTMGQSSWEIDPQKTFIFHAMGPLNVTGYAPTHYNLDGIQQESAQADGSSLEGYIATISLTKVPVKLGYRLYCESSNSLVYPPIGTKMYYKEPAASTFKLFHVVNESNRTSTINEFLEFNDGQKYDFRARFGSHQVDTLGVKVIDGYTYDVILPNAACSELGL